MAQSTSKRVTGTLAEMTGRSDEELRLAMVVAGLVGALIGALRLVNYLEGLGFFGGHGRR